MDVSMTQDRTTSRDAAVPRQRVDLDTDDPARLALLARLRAGEWLTKGQIAVVTGLGASTVDRYLRDGVIGHRLKPGRGGYRLGDPDDVLDLLFPAADRS
jgi:hypothetical protein